MPVPLPRPTRLRWLALLLVAGACAPGTATPLPETPGLVRFFSPATRQLENDLRRLTGELATLPTMPPGPKGGTHGFHGSGSASGREWVQVDLGRPRPIEAIAIVPVNLDYGSGEGRGYGFPTGFRVEVADREDFLDARLINDPSRPPAQGAPVVMIETESLRGRYVRIVATEPWILPGTAQPSFALGELLVFSGGRNIAPGKPVTASRSIEGRPFWSAAYLVDGQSSLGHPVAAERSTTNGYHGRIEPAPDVTKWVQLDLGRVLPLDEVRIVPANPVDWATTHGFGFPERFRVEACNEPVFRDPVVLLDHTEIPFPNPGENPVVIPLDQQPARFVRFTATRLWPRAGDYVFALAEMQVFSGGKNVTRKAAVDSSDSLTVGFWKEDFLVDGFDSRNRIEDDELGWLRGIARRHALAATLRAESARLQEAIARTTSRLAWSAGIIGLGLCALVVVTVVRSRTLRRRETDRLRERIAGDLHDEIGSNLGSIALLSEIGEGPEQLHEINRVARETVDSMHDIAWVIRSGHDTLEDLLLRMREVASSMLGPLDWTFETEPSPPPKRRITLRFKRNALLFFKETLHNLIRHADATRARVMITVHRDRFRLEVVDDGKGFEADDPATGKGAGLRNLANRAHTLGGTMTLNSSPGKGTTVLLEARLR